MAEFAGYKCDGPDCNNEVDKKTEKAGKWLKVSISNDSYKEDLTFCSYNCLEDLAHETVKNQHPEF